MYQPPRIREGTERRRKKSEIHTHTNFRENHPNKMLSLTSYCWINQPRLIPIPTNAPTNLTKQDDIPGLSPRINTSACISENRHIGSLAGK